MTLLARRAAVRSRESEASLRMIEARHLAPRPRVVADFARRPPRLANRRPDSHRGLMRVHVAARATEIGKFVDLRIVQFRLFPVTVAAGHGDVPP